MFKAEPDTTNVRFFIELLERNRGWLSARVICEQTGWSDRDVRSYAEAADGMIISGQKGYRHLRHATPEETHHSQSWLIAQGKKMIKRALAIRRHAHQLVG